MVKQKYGEKITLLETNISPLKINGWKLEDVFFLWDGLFSEAMLVSGSVVEMYFHPVPTGLIRYILIPSGNWDPSEASAVCQPINPRRSTCMDH